ncbi:MAG: hypothetical protein ABSE89_12155 [Sedimentisphaerales bacterium]
MKKQAKGHKPKFGVFIYSSETHQILWDLLPRKYEIPNKYKAVQLAIELFEQRENDNIYVEVWKKDKKGHYGKSGEPIYKSNKK